MAGNMVERDMVLDRQGAVQIGLENITISLMTTAFLCLVGSIGFVILNMNSESKNIYLSLGDHSVEVHI
jgi:hypothetical protein